MKNLSNPILIITLLTFSQPLLAAIEMLGDYAVKDDPDTSAVEGNLTVDTSLTAKTVKIVKENGYILFTINEDGVKGNSDFSLTAGNSNVDGNSMALGNYNTLRQFSLAAGEENTIENNSLAIGSYNVVKDWYWPMYVSKGGNALIGSTNRTKDVPAEGYYDQKYFTSCSIAVGNNNVIGGMASAAIGYKNSSLSTWYSSGDNNTAPAISIGRKNTAVDNSVAIGDENVACANSFSMGSRLKNYSGYMTSLGRLNTVPETPASDTETWNADDPLIVIGNGHIDEAGNEVRSDALIIKKSGDAVLNGNFIIKEPSQVLSMGRFGRHETNQAKE